MVYTAYPDKDDGSREIEEILDKHRDGIIGLCVSMGMDADDPAIDELMQDVRILIWQYEQLNRAFILRHVRDRFIDQKRKEQRGAASMDPHELTEVAMQREEEESVVSGVPRPDFEDQCLAAVDRQHEQERYFGSAPRRRRPRRTVQFCKNMRGGYDFRLED